ncbi:putative signal-TRANSDUCTION sensor protein [Hydrogenimonas sp.]|nr:putative signal-TRANSDUCTION sensor protein [Hydrogenimonas sp.]
MRRPEPRDFERFLKEEDYIVSKTDLKGRITYCNKTFIEISGYSEEELLGAPHSILRHPDMPKIVFKLLWERIQNRQEIFAFVKNLCKDGGFYWVFANVTATVDPDGNIRDYHSVRRKPSREGVKVMESIYKRLLEEERRGGMEASASMLETILESEGTDYDKFVNSLQKPKTA